MRKNELKKTSKPNIYQIDALSGRTEYIVRFSYLGKTYGQRNFTKLFGCTTLKQTEEMFNNVKAELSKGNNPFLKKHTINLDTLWEDYKENLKGNHLYILNGYYEKHIQPLIGKVDIDEVEEKHIYRILNGTLKESGSSNRMKLRTILNPIFKKAIKKGYIKTSPLEFIKFEKPANREELSSIVAEDYKSVTKKLYKSVLEIENIEDRLASLFGLMTARRRNEILQYKHSDIIDGKLFVPKEYTKSNRSDEFPLSKEMLELIEQLPQERDNLFTIPLNRITKMFGRAVEKSNLKLTKDGKFTFHQTRHLFQSIMIKETNNPPLVDRCISHTQNNVMSIYLSFQYENRKEVFKKYWEIMREDNTLK